MDTNPQQSYEWMRFSDLSKLISLPEWQRLTSENIFQKYTNRFCLIQQNINDNPFYLVV